MRTLAIDIETYSPVDLRKSGVYPYAEHPDFEVLVICYSFDGGRVHTYNEDPATDFYFVDALTDPNVLKTAWNAPFEMACLSKWFGVELDPAQWSDTMVLAAMCGLPLSLEACAAVLGGAQKDKVGGVLIRYFCVPCKPTKANGGRTRNLPSHDPEKFARFVEYCRQDVVTEQDIRRKVEKFPVTELEWRLWIIDQHINRRGVLIDRQLAENAVRLSKEYNEKLIAEAVELTGLENPNSVSQLKKWLEEALDVEIDSLNKKAIPGLLKAADTDTARRVIQIRQQLGKTSVKKYTAMLHGVCKDGRIRGLLQYYGANRTGRWAGRLVQVQNLAKNFMADLDTARNIVKRGDLELFEMFYDNIPDVLSQLLRTAFISGEGKKLIPSDFSAIEARVLAWLAGETWRLDVFNTHGRIYEASAAAMFKVPLETIKKGQANFGLRAKGKVAELALGYQGGPGALIAMGALDMGLAEEELPAIVSLWRASNPAIVDYWKRVNRAAIEAVKFARKTSVGCLSFEFNGKLLFIVLPSGRRLSYYRPRLVPGKYGDSLQYEGMDQEKKTWGKVDTYGGKLVENIVQAVARDLLAESLIRMEDAGVPVVMHVHDEVIPELPEDVPVKAVTELMKVVPTWATGLPLNADSYETKYYKKDD